MAKTNKQGRYSFKLLMIGCGIGGLIEVAAIGSYFYTQKLLPTAIGVAVGVVVVLLTLGVVVMGSSKEG